jgi:hypothetical protein
MAVWLYWNLLNCADLRPEPAIVTKKVMQVLLVLVSNNLIIIARIIICHFYSYNLLHFLKKHDTCTIKQQQCIKWKPSIFLFINNCQLSIINVFINCLNFNFSLDLLFQSIIFRNQFFIFWLDKQHPVRMRKLCSRVCP